jgi:hypothetical protein
MGKLVSPLASSLIAFPSGGYSAMWAILPAIWANSVSRRDHVFIVMLMASGAFLLLRFPSRMPRRRRVVAEIVAPPELIWHLDRLPI